VACGVVCDPTSARSPVIPSRPRRLLSEPNFVELYCAQWSSLAPAHNGLLFPLPMPTVPDDHPFPSSPLNQMMAICDRCTRMPAPIHAGHPPTMAFHHGFSRGPVHPHPLSPFPIHLWLFSRADVEDNKFAFSSMVYAQHFGIFFGLRTLHLFSTRADGHLRACPTVTI